MNKNTISYVILIALLIVTSVVSIRLFLYQKSEHDALDVRTFPYAIDDWRGKDLEITEREYKILETRNLIFREYINSKNEKIYIFVIYSETNRSVFHPPEACLIGSGITINDIKSEKIEMGKKEFLTNKLYLEKNGEKDIALYCYKAGNLYTDNFYLQQIYFTLNQLFGKRRGGATIRASMPVDNEEANLATLKGFMRGAILTLEQL
jgi:EpsI family protein